MTTKKVKEPETVIGYKAFKKDLTCRSLKYKVGETFTESGDIALCSNGFHFCQNPLDIFDYYDLVNEEGELTEFAVVEATGKVISDDKKSVTNKITIKSKLELPSFIKASIDFLWDKCSDATTSSGHSSRQASSGDSSRQASSGDSSQLASSGDSSQLASSGDSSRQASSGHSSQLASSGDSSQLASSGDYSRQASSGHSSQLASSGHSSQLASSGHYSQLASSGHSSQLASSGDSSRQASSGHYSQLASSGDSSQLASSGHSSQLTIKGDNSIGAAIGRNSKIKAVKGTWITLAEYDKDWKVLCVKSAQVDGKKLKSDVWYKLQGGKFVEVK